MTSSKFDQQHAEYQRAADSKERGANAKASAEIAAYARVAEAVRCAPMMTPPSNFAAVVAACCADFEERAGLERWLLLACLVVMVALVAVSAAPLLAALAQLGTASFVNDAPWSLLLTAALVALVIRASEALSIGRLSRPPG